MVSPIEIKEQIERTLLAIPGVTGVGIGKNSPESINIYLKSACPKITCNIPESIGGVPVKQIITGKIEALNLLDPTLASRKDKIRPAPAGVSIGHFLVSAGTFGIVCYDATTGERLILSNNHILANESSIQNSRARVEDLILQPGVADDANIISNGLATLDRWINIDELGENEVDCAVARPTNPNEIITEILEIGRVTTVGNASIGNIVQKSGRSSGLTEGVVVDTNATVKVDYTNFKGATFRNQVIITPGIGIGGDSGSAIIRKSDNKAIGLLVAGSEFVTVANSMSRVAQALNINLGDANIPLPSQEPEGSNWGTVAALGAMSLPFIFMKKSKDNRRYNG